MTVVAEAGVGKSRLAAEFTTSLGDRVTVARGRCLPYGEGITFWPIAEVVKQLSGIDAQDGRRRGNREDRGPAHRRLPTPPLSPSTSRQSSGRSDVAYPVQETFWAIRKLFESIATTRPLVVAFDDIHWGEADLPRPRGVPLGVEHGIARSSSCARLGRNCLTFAPAGETANANVDSIRLGPLTSDESDRVIENLVAGAELDRGVQARISEVAEGNPLVRRGGLADARRRRAPPPTKNGQWIPVGDLVSFDIPPTINALLDARLEGIPAEERAVLQRASVMGKLFSWTAVIGALPEEDRPRSSAPTSRLSSDER